MVADGHPISPPHLYHGVWHVKYVEEKSDQRLPVVTGDTIYMVNQVLGKKSDDVCLAAFKRDTYEFNSKYGPVFTKKKEARDYVLWKAWQGVPMTGLIKVGDAIFSGGMDKVYAANAGDGKEIWSSEVPGEVRDLAFHDGRLLVLCKGGNIVSFGQ